MIEEKYRNIFDSVSDGLIISDLESGRIIEANSAAYDMHGYPKENLLDNHFQHSSILIARWNSIKPFRHFNRMAYSISR